jgi:hypothetical protein
LPTKREKGFSNILKVLVGGESLRKSLPKRLSFTLGRTLIADAKKRREILGLFGTIN